MILVPVHATVACADKRTEAIPVSIHEDFVRLARQVAKQHPLFVLGIARKVLTPNLLILCGKIGIDAVGIEGLSVFPIDLSGSGIDAPTKSSALLLEAL